MLVDENKHQLSPPPNALRQTRSRGRDCHAPRCCGHRRSAFAVIRRWPNPSPRPISANEYRHPLEVVLPVSRWPADSITHSLVIPSECGRSHRAYRVVTCLWIPPVAVVSGKLNPNNEHVGRLPSLTEDVRREAASLVSSSSDFRESFDYHHYSRLVFMLLLRPEVPISDVVINGQLHRAPVLIVRTQAWVQRMSHRLKET